MLRATINSIEQLGASSCVVLDCYQYLKRFTQGHTNQPPHKAQDRNINKERIPLVKVNSKAPKGANTKHKDRGVINQVTDYSQSTKKRCCWPHRRTRVLYFWNNWFCVTNIQINNGRSYWRNWWRVFTYGQTYSLKSLTAYALNAFPFRTIRDFELFLALSAGDLKRHGLCSKVVAIDKQAGWLHHTNGLAEMVQSSVNNSKTAALGFAPTIPRAHKPNRTWFMLAGIRIYRCAQFFYAATKFVLSSTERFSTWVFSPKKIGGEYVLS